MPASHCRNFCNKSGSDWNHKFHFENPIIRQFWWLVELLESFHGCPHTLLTQLKLECKDMVLAKTRSSKVPCTVSELQSQVSKEVYILICFGLSTFNKKGHRFYKYLFYLVYVHLNWKNKVFLSFSSKIGWSIDKKISFFYTFFLSNHPI